MGLILSGALAGGGAALQQSGMQLQRQWGAEELEKMREEAATARNSALIEAQKFSQERGFAHADTSQEKAQKFTAGENVAGREFQASQQERAFTHADTSQEKAQKFQSGQQERGFTHAEKMQTTSLEAAAKENALNRQVTREGQGIQREQVEILAKGAELDREIKKIQLDNAKTVEDLKTKLLVATDPKVKAELTDYIHVLTGKDKDKFLPVPLKDEMGNITGYKIFDTVRGQFADNQPAAGGAQNRPPLSSFGPQGQKPPASKAPAVGGIIGAPTPGVNVPLPRTTASPEPSKIEQIQRALKTPNLTTEQKAALSLQLQDAMREEGTLGQ